MTHAGPAPRGARGKSGPAPSGTSATPTAPAESTDVLGPGVHRALAWALPLTLGLLFGYWAAANRRGGGPVTAWNLLFGLVTALVFTALYVAVRALAPRLRRESHALLWAGLAGASLGFLVSQTGWTWLRATGLGLIVAAGVFPVLFYRFYTHEDAEGHRVG